MIRARFKIADADFRPVVWPIQHPYWVTGGDGVGRHVLVAYADSVDQLVTWWPDAVEIDAEECLAYTFTDRFPKPEWMP